MQTTKEREWRELVKMGGFGGRPNRNIPEEEGKALDVKQCLFLERSSANTVGCDKIVFGAQNFIKNYLM